jgi:hypothetical protein
MTHPRRFESPTFRDVDPGQPRASERFAVPSPWLEWYNPIAVAQYSPTFVDVTIVPEAGGQQAVSPAPAQACPRMLLTQQWGAGLTRGTAMATLVGGLLLASPVGTVAAQALDPPPPVSTADDDGFLERLIEAIGEASPLWQFVSPGDGSALWRLIERAGPEHEVWDVLHQAGPDHWVWERLAELGADNPIWDKILPEGADSSAVARSTAADQRLGAAGAPAGWRVEFVERTGNENPLFGADVGQLPAPAFVDIDGDGDFDAFIGSSYVTGTINISGTVSVADVYDPITDKICDGYVQFFENLDVGHGGGIGNAIFVERTGVDNPFDGADVGCYPKPAFVDIDDAGDFDAFIGNKDGTIEYFENVGDAANPVFVERTGGSNPFDGEFVGGHSAPAVADIDGDADFDVFIGNKAGEVKFFENDGTPGNPSFVEQTGAYNPFDAVQLVGGNSTPTFADIDRRGDADALVGDYDGYIHFFENLDFDGDYALGDPEFVERTGDDNPFNGVDLGYHSTPALVDVDGDGDFDAFIGTAFSGALPDNPFDHAGDNGELGAYDLVTQRKGQPGEIRFFENPNMPGVGGATELFAPLQTLGPWVGAAAAGLAGTVGAGAALMKRRRRRS